MDNSECINTFYHAFAKGDSETMASCYHDEIVFDDPAFGTLKGDDAKNMWRMLVERSKGQLHIEFSDVEANGNTGSANWRAEYPYGPKKRKVVNHITASFEFKEGMIVRHTDVFNLWKWTQQALGLSGYLLGWSPFMKNKIQASTNKLLKKYTDATNQG